MPFNKKYIVFCFDKYSPEGGWDDVLGGFDEWDDAFATMESRMNNSVLKDICTQYGQIVNTESGEVQYFNNETGEMCKQS